MNPDYLARMSAKQLDNYGNELGLDMSKAKSIDAKVELIESKRNAEVSISVIGLELKIPKKRIADRRLGRLLSHQLTDDQAEAALVLLLGDEQFAELVKACTDEDGTVDTTAMGMVFVEVLGSDELKNL